jgi:hypothetical protein
MLRMAAVSLRNSDSYLGAKYRQFRARMEPGEANKAMAAELARLIYRLLTNGQEWVDRGAQAHETKQREHDQKIPSTQSRAARLPPRTRIIATTTPMNR